MEVKKGQIVEGTVTGIKPYGAFIAVENGPVGLAYIEDLSVVRIKSPEERVQVGQKITCMIKSIDEETGRINLSYKDCLGTWEENAKLFTPGDTVPAYVSNIDEKNGVWIALAPNFQGLAEKIEDDPVLSNLQSGDRITVYIKSINTSNEKVKLVIVSKSDRVVKKPPLKYYIDVDEVKHIDKWVYSPEESLKNTQTIFE